MKVVYIGYAIDKESCDKQLGASVAGNNMQLGILKELKNKMKHCLDIISVYPTASYPKEKKIYFKTHTNKISKNIESILVGFINIPFIKDLTQSISVFRNVRKIIKKEKECKILTFNARPSVAIPSIILKKIYKCELICLLADPPVDIQERYGLNKIIMNIFWKLIEKSILKYDKIIALNKKAIEIYAPNKPYIIIDGGIDIEDYEISKKEIISKHNKKVIVFSGALTEYNGIKEAIQAMNYVKNKNIELHIYGNGYLQEYVERAERFNPNVIYKGIVSNKEMRMLQSSSDLLINPRRVDDMISKVTFPSKIIEYMLSRTPVISTRLNGLTDEYLENIYILDNLEPEYFGKTIQQILEKSEEELHLVGENAAKFILNNKSWKNQCEKIYKFISVYI